MPSLIDRAKNGINAIFDRGTQSPFQESGVAGYQIYGGYLVRNEKNPKLVGQNRFVEAQEILSNISIIAASVRYFLNLVAKPQWKVEPADESSEAKAIAEFIDEVINSMETNWSRNVRRSGMYRYHGYGIQEWVAKKRDDGKIGLADIEVRPWNTIERWDIDPKGNILGVEQHDRQTGGRYYIPRKKIIYFVDDLFTDNPEGQGWFRSLIEPADRMRAYLEIEQLGFQRDMSGIPIGRAPLQEMNAKIGKPKPGGGVYTPEDIAAQITGLQNFIQMEVKKNNTSVLLDSATYKDTGADGSKTTSVLKWGLDLLTGKSESMPEMGAAIERLTYEMARIMGTESILIGQSGGGSLALSRDKSQNLYLMVNSTVIDMAESFERDLIHPICQMNGFDEKLWPSLTAEDVAFRDVEAVAATLRDMATAGAVLSPEDPAIDDIRDMLGISRAEGALPEAAAPDKKPDDKTPPEGGGDEGDPDPDGEDPLEKLKITIDIDEEKDDLRNQAANIAGQHGMVRLEKGDGGYALIMATLSPNLFLLHRYGPDGTRMAEVKHESKVDAVEEALRCGYGADLIQKEYNPNQPRDPAGEGGGQWVADGGGDSGIKRTEGKPQEWNDGSTYRMVTFTDGEGSWLEIMENAKYAPRENSIADFVVPESKRGQGLSSKLLDRAFQDYPPETVSAAASSKVVVGMLHRRGFRVAGQPNASLEDALRIRNEDSSVTMTIPKVEKKFNPNQPRDPAGSSTGGQWAGGDDTPDVIFEVAPNPDDKELSARWDSLTDEQKAEITKAIAEDITPRVLNELGIEGKLQEAMGGYEGKINPSFALNVSDKPFEVAGIMGEALSQKAMVVAGDKPFEGLERIGMAAVSVSDASKLSEVQDRIVDLADGFTYRNSEMQFLNFTGMDDSEFASQINSRLGNSYQIKQSEIYSTLMEESEYASGKGASKGTARRKFRDSLSRDVSRALDGALKGFGKAEGWGKGVEETVAKIQARLDALEKKYNPNQPRDPAGTGTGGQWTSGSAGLTELPKGKLIPITAETNEEMLADQIDKDLEELLAMAEENQNRLADLANLPGVKFATAPEGDLDNPMDATPKGRKSKSSILRKLSSDPDYNGPGDLKDISRGTFVVHSLTNSDGLIRELSASSEIYDKGWKRLDSGYFDRKVYIKHPNGGLSEIQIIPRGMYQAKSNGGHDLYVVSRDLNVSESVRASANVKMREMYATAITGSGFEELYDGN